MNDEDIRLMALNAGLDHNEMAWTQSCAIDIRARGEK